MIRNTLQIECLIESLGDYVSAKQEHDKARDNYDGYSWGYHGHYYVERMEKAAESFQERLDKYIDDKIEQKLQTMLANQS